MLADISSGIVQMIEVTIVNVVAAANGSISSIGETMVMVMMIV